MNSDRRDLDCSPEEVKQPNAQSDVTRTLLTKRESLRGQLKELDATIARVQQEYSAKLEQLQAQKRPLEEALQHVDALLRFEGYFVGNNRPNERENLAVMPNTKTSVTDAAFDLLSALHKPLHYKYLASMLQERNIYIPGKDPAATLLSRISRDSRFKRTKKRGVYALSTWRIRSSKSKRTRKAKRH